MNSYTFLATALTLLAGVATVLDGAPFMALFALLVVAGLLGEDPS